MFQPEEHRWTISKDNRKSLGSRPYVSSRPGSMRAALFKCTYIYIYMTWIRHESVVSRARGHAYTRPRRKCIVMDAAHDTLPLDLRLSRFINRENSKSRQNANDKYPVILSTISFFLSFFQRESEYLKRACYGILFLIAQRGKRNRENVYSYFEIFLRVLLHSG